MIQILIIALKYSEKLLSLKEMLYIDNTKGIYLSSKVNRVSCSASLNRENFAIIVLRTSVQPPHTTSRIRLI